MLAAAIYALLLAALYSFVIVREASLFQVVLTFALAVVAPLLFFWLQTMIASDADQLPVGGLLKHSLASFWKLLLVTLPLIGVAILVAYLLAKAQTKFGTQVPGELAEIPRRIGSAAERSKTPPIQWRTALISTARYLLLGLVLPLIAIQLWVTTAREGLVATLKKVLTLVSRAFAPQSVLIYVVGFVVFGLVPYLLLFRSTSTKRAWLDLSLFSVRLAVVFALTLLGWVITVKAMALVSRNNPPPQPEAT